MAIAIGQRRIEIRKALRARRRLREREGGAGEAVDRQSPKESVTIRKILLRFLKNQSLTGKMTSSTMIMRIFAMIDEGIIR